MSAPEPPAPRRAARRLPRANFVLHAASWLEAGLAMSNHQSAFYDFELADNNSFEQWSAEGGTICCSAPIGAGRACSRLTSRRRSSRPGTRHCASR